MFLVVLVFVSVLGSSQSLLAQKCHYSLSSIDNCPSDLTEAHCSEGLISVGRVRYTNDNCNIVCPTCCIETDENANSKIKGKVISECEQSKTCSLTAIESGSVYVEYTCTDTSTTTKSHTINTFTPGVNKSEPSTSTASSTPDSELTTSWTTESPDVYMNTSTYGQTQRSTDKQKREKEIPTEIFVAVSVIIIACLACAVLAIFLCQRYKIRKQQTQADKYEMVDQSEIYPSSTRANEDGMRMTPPSDHSVDMDPTRHDDQGGNEYDNPSEMPGNIKAATSDACSDNEYDHLDHRLARQDGKLIDNVNAHSENLYNRVHHEEKMEFIGTNDQVYDTTREAVREVHTTLDNTYDNVSNTEREHAGIQNSVEAYSAEGVYDVCKTNGMEATTLSDDTYDVATSHQTVS